MILIGSVRMVEASRKCLIKMLKLDAAGVRACAPDKWVPLYKREVPRKGKNCRPGGALKELGHPALRALNYF